ncbi:MAG TPA: hypothetical protein P5205_20200 [Candidatus Paceibacterota bacterium]|nr:hypothetical protein [Verrucomicrobiota bacterium]HSA12688.1 hypothetical protein [Candidatus Paceibacterota bacterium]
MSDLRLQRSLLRRFAAKGLLLLVLFLTLDRLAGWVFLRGLDRYYGMDVPAQVLCVGHSHLVLGVDKIALERELGVPVAKFAVEGANTSDRLMMIRYYFKRQPDSVRAVVYGVDAHAFTGAGLSSSSYRLLFPFIADPDVRGYIRRYCPSRTEYLLRRVLCTPRYTELTLSLAVRGYLKKWTNYKFGKVNVEVLRRQIEQGNFRRISFDEDNVRQFNLMAEFVTTRGARLLLAYIPTIDVFNRAEPAKFQRSISIFSGLASTNSNIVYLDYNTPLEARHDLFRDRVHLNREGQKELTARLATDLKRVLDDPALVRREQAHGRAN